VRGVENYPVILGDLQLPASARLKLHKIENIVTQVSYRSTRPRDCFCGMTP
jgi:hypothetical protein